MGDRSRLTRILCVNCNICINTLRRYPALTLDPRVTGLLCSWVYPLIITEEDYICEACRDLAMFEINQSLQLEVSGSGDQHSGPSHRGHTHVCLLCGCSILRRQSDKILRDTPTDLQRSIIAIIENRLAPRQNQSSTSDNVIHVFCPKCNTEVPHSAEGIQQDQTKIIITKVYRYFEQEYEELKKMYKDVDLTPLSKFRQRTSLATGVSDSMLKQILREDERRREAVDRARAVKRRKDSDSLIGEDSSDDNDDDLDAVADAAADVQEPEQSYDDTETLVVKIEQPTEFNNDEPEIFVPSSVKVEPGDYEHNNKQVQTDPISLDIKTEPQDEAETTIETQELNEPTTSKRKARKRPKKTQDSSTQQHTLGESSIATTSRNILWAALEQSNLLDETGFTTEETHEEEGFS